MSDAPTGTLWGLTDHVCLCCLGRVLEQKWPPAAPGIFRCSNCGATGEATVRSVCACGSKIGPKDAGIRCVRNPRPRPELLCEIIAKETT